MTTQQYYKHVRSLGAFKASEALKMAREAAALDTARQAFKAACAGPSIVSREVMPDGLSVPLSFGIKVF